MNAVLYDLVILVVVLYGLASLITLVALLFYQFKDVHMLATKEDERFVIFCGQS